MAFHFSHDNLYNLKSGPAFFHIFIPYYSEFALQSLIALYYFLNVPFPQPPLLDRLLLKFSVPGMFPIPIFPVPFPMIRSQ